MGSTQDRPSVAGAALAVPRDHPADRRVRGRDPTRESAGRGRGLHPRVRRRPVVGAVAAQPDGPAVEGPVAVRARGDGDLGSLPAAVLRARAGTGGRDGGRVRAGDLRSGRGGDGRPPRDDRRRGPSATEGRDRGARHGAREAHPMSGSGTRSTSVPPPRRPLRRPRRGTGRQQPGRVRAPRAAGGAGRGGDHRGHRGGRFWRGDAVEMLVASADRVAAPCPVAGPGLCGGCDFQHVALCTGNGR